MEVFVVVRISALLPYGADPQRPSSKKQVLRQNPLFLFTGLVLSPRRPDFSVSLGA